jgi:PAS domain S-box-containing protein
MSSCNNGQGESTLVRLIRQLPGAVVLLSADDFRVRYMSDAYRTYLPKAFKDKDLVGARLIDYSADGENDSFIPILRRISENGKGEEIRDFRTRNRDEAEFWVDWIGSPIDNGTERWDVLVQITDITECRKMKESLKELNETLEEEHRSLFDSMQEGFSLMEGVLDEEGRLVNCRILDVNPIYEEQTGLRAEQVLGRLVTDFLPIVEPAWFDRYDEVLRTGRSITFEEYNASLGRWFEVNAYSLMRNHLFAATFSDITERKQAVEQLQRSEDKFSKAFYGNTSAMAITRFEDGRLIDTNDRWLAMNGITRDEVIGRTPAEHHLWSSEERERMIGDLEKHGSFFGMEFKFVRKNGEAWTGLMSAQVIPLEGERAILSSLLDITEQKRSADALKESETLLKTVLETTTDSVFLKDRQSRWLLANPAVLQIVGKPLEEVLGKDDAEIYDDPEIGRGLMASDRRIMDSGVGEMLEERVQTPTGYRTFLTTKTPYRDSEGKIVGIVGMARDITLRKKAEEELKESEEKYRGLFDNIREGVSLRRLIFNEKGEIVEAVLIDANPAALDVYGASSVDQLRGKEYRMMASPKMSALALEVVKRMRATGQPITDEEHSDINDRDYLVTASPLGKDLVITTSFDITERKRIEEALKRSNAELQQFAYVASHDLKEPLRMVTSYLLLLEKKNKDRQDEKSKEYMHYAIDGATRMNGMIDDLLVYARVGTHGKSFAPVRMEDVLVTVLNDLAVGIQESGASITHDDLPMIVADGTQMVSLLENLIGNAIKYRGEEAPRIHVSARDRGNEWVFSVQDNGIGIDPVQMGRLFQMFQRLHTRAEYEGSGIGLAIAKKIVERHGGRIWVESEAGKGATFFFTIPRARQIKEDAIPSPR